MNLNAQISTFVHRCADVRSQRPPVNEVLTQALTRIGWEPHLLKRWAQLEGDAVVQAGPDALLYRTGLALAHEANKDTEAAYHNFLHTSEAVLAGEVLLSAEPWSSDEKKHHGLRLLVAMVAHDVKHPGSFGSAPGSLEALSAQAFSDQWMTYSSAPSHDLDAVVAIVHGTEFIQGPARNFSHQEQAPNVAQFRLQVLANDADILASVLPQTGPERGALLAQEGIAAGNENAAIIASWQGRLLFLTHAQLRSRGASLMGATALQQAQIAAITALTPEALDAQERTAAEAAVREAINTNAQLRPAAAKP